MGKQTILVVDDEPQIVRLVQACLEEAGFRVVVAYDGEEGLAAVRREKPALLVLDILMPGMDGLEFTRRIRREQEVPIIMLTTRAEKTDRIVGLELGADDYVTKPFSPRELVARVRAVLRRAQAGPQPPPVLRVGPITLDRETHTVTVSGQPVDLTPTEFSVLEMLMTTPGRALTRADLLEAMADGVYPTNQENLLAAPVQVRTLARLVEDLRLLALADAGQLRLNKVPLDLRPLLQETLEAHRARAQEKGVALALRAPPALPLVLADRDRIAHVVGDLLSNALRYVLQGGHVTVRVEDRGREVVVAVADDGPGVPEEELGRLFERFWRGDPARRRATGGSGLGLSIARYIVEAHRGRIWAEPTPGGGLTVAFALPSAALASTGPVSASSAP